MCARESLGDNNKVVHTLVRRARLHRRHEGKCAGFSSAFFPGVCVKIKWKRERNLPGDKCVSKTIEHISQFSST